MSAGLETGLLIVMITATTALIMVIVVQFLVILRLTKEIARTANETLWEGRRRLEACTDPLVARIHATTELENARADRLKPGFASLFSGRHTARTSAENAAHEKANEVLRRGRTRRVLRPMDDVPVKETEPSEESSNGSAVRAAERPERPE